MSEALIQALKQQIEGLKLAQLQANQIVSKLMGSSLTYEQRNELFHLVLTHTEEQERSRSAQLGAVMRTALMQLNSITQETRDQQTKEQLVEVIKALTLTVECANATIETRKVKDEQDPTTAEG